MRKPRGLRFGQSELSGIKGFGVLGLRVRAFWSVARFPGLRVQILGFRVSGNVQIRGPHETPVRCLEAQETWLRAPKKHISRNLDKDTPDKPPSFNITSLRNTPENVVGILILFEVYSLMKGYWKVWTHWFVLGCTKVCSLLDNILLGSPRRFL